MSVPVDKSYFERFCAAGKRRFAKKGECLYSFDCLSEYVYCIDEGLCALLSITKSGEEKIYHYFSSGNIINFTPAYLDVPATSPVAAFYTYAKTDCYIYEISYKNFHSLLSENPDLNRYIMSLFASHFTDVLEHFHFMQEASVTSRLCKTLIDFNHPIKGNYLVDKHFNYVELGRYLGVHTVTISRIMRALKLEGAIEKNGHTIIIKDFTILEEYINETRTLSY